MANEIYRSDNDPGDDRFSTPPISLELGGRKMQFLGESCIAIPNLVGSGKSHVFDSKRFP
jgi:hypothetical protein